MKAVRGWRENLWRVDLDENRFYWKIVDEKIPAVKKESLGKTGLALLPLQKLKLNTRRAVSFEREIHDFLSTTFNGYTVYSGNISGHWKDDLEKNHYGEHRAYKVALPHEDAIKAFEIFLAGLAFEMEEVCIYVEIGTDILLVYAQDLGG